MRTENDTLKQQYNELEAAKALQAEEFQRTHQEELLRFDSLQTEMNDKLATIASEKDTIAGEKEQTWEQLLMLQTESTQKQADFESLEKDLKSVLEQKDHELEELNAKYRELEEKYQVLLLWLVVKTIICLLLLITITQHTCRTKQRIAGLCLIFLCYNRRSSGVSGCCY